MKTLFMLVLLSFLTMGYAHDHWIMADNYSPEPGEMIHLTISSGHHFPKSSFILPEKFMFRQFVISPAGQFEFSTQIERQQRTEAHQIIGDGVHLFQFEVKKPQMKRIKFTGRMLIATNGWQGSSALKTGTGLEIVPHETLFSLKAGDDIAIRVLNEDQEVTASCLVFSPDGSQTLNVHSDNESILRLKSAGTYMLITHYNGAGFTLVFHVREDVQ